MPAPTKRKSLLLAKLENETADGRKQRSSRSRHQIIEALFELLHEGDMSPSAIRVAGRANVGLRTVFRHFEDMDSIYNEMTEEVLMAIKPKLIAPYASTTWRGRLMESVEKRAEIYESIFPIKVCLSLRRFQSDFLQQQYEHDLSMERSSLKSILPDEITNDRILFATLESTLSFSTWRRLRQDQKLSDESAKKSIRLMLKGLTENVDAD